MKSVTVKEEFQTIFGHILMIDRVDGLQTGDMVKDNNGREFLVNGFKMSNNVSETLGIVVNNIS